MGLVVVPPPQRKQRARSLPVPRGRTATGGWTCRFALSKINTVFMHKLVFSVLFVKLEGGGGIQYLWHPGATQLCHPLHTPGSCTESKCGKSAAWRTKQTSSKQNQNNKNVKSTKHLIIEHCTRGLDLHWTGCKLDEGLEVPETF